VVAVARCIMVIIWHLLSNPRARYHDLGSDYFLTKIDREKKARAHIRQLQALGFAVALTPAD
jgi:transposase